MEIPSWAFRMARERPRVCRRSFSLIARPAASSAALLMRSPELSFSMDFSRREEVPANVLCALSDRMFWLIRRDMLDSSLNRAALPCAFSLYVSGHAIIVVQVRASPLSERNSGDSAPLDSSGQTDTVSPIAILAIGVLDAISLDEIQGFSGPERYFLPLSSPIYPTRLLFSNLLNLPV